MVKRPIWVAHNGTVASAMTRCLEHRDDEVLEADRSVVDLRKQIAVELGWTPTIPLVQGVAQSYLWFPEKAQAAHLAA